MDTTSHYHDCVREGKCVELARIELNETPEKRSACLEELRHWAENQHSLICRKDDFFLMRFLRSVKYDVEKAEIKLANYYKLRTETREWFVQRDANLPQLHLLLNIGVFLPLLVTDSGGRVVVVIKTCSHDPSVTSLDDVFRIGLMALDLFLHHHGPASIHGIVAIFDMAGVSLSHARQLTVPLIRRAVHSWQDCYPVRVKSLDFFNSPSYVNVVLNIFRRFMKEKLRERVHVHGYNLESLHKYIEKNILPEEYGGSNGTLADLQEYWLQKVTRSQNWFIEDDKYKYIPEKEELEL